MTLLSPLVLRVSAAAIILMVGAGVYLYHRRRRRAAIRLGDHSLLTQLLGEDISTAPRARFAIIIASAILIGGALLDASMRPNRPATRGPVILILDASGSMLVDDVGPRRLDLQRAIAEDFVALAPDLPIGVVAFAGRAFSLTPPTRDRDAISMYLSTLDPTIVTQTGSALGAAIRQGVSLLAGSDGTVRGGTIILFGDGDETGDRATTLDAADLAGQNGIAVHAVGIGTRRGGPVPALDLTTGTSNGYLRDRAGDVRLSVLGEDLMRDMAARSAGGMYFAATGSGTAQRIANALRGPEVPDSSPGIRIPMLMALAAGAFLLLVLEPLSQRRALN